MAGPIATAIQGKYTKDAARKAAELADQQRKAGVQLLNELDWQPMYASERVPTYQRNPSAARDYLDSFLMGNNPDAVSPVSPNAAMKKADAQRAQDAMFGTPQERMARERDYFASTPWKVTAPTRPVNANGQANPAAAVWTAQHADFAGGGMNKNLDDALKEGGLDLPGTQTPQQKWKGGIGNAGGLYDYSLHERDVKAMLDQVYQGDADRMAADIRAAGSFDRLAQQQRGRR